MTGPDHFLEAESCLSCAESAGTGSASEAYFLQAAQAHATLALVAATAPRGSGEWQAVVSPTKDEEIVP